MKTVKKLPSSVSDAKICLTAAGILIHEGKVLLVKHKKLGVWLAPGGHIEANELPHQAAEREFWEETGVRVVARPDQHARALAADQSEYVPSPILSNLHWISQDNYKKRIKGAPGAKGCEQHLSLLYLVDPVKLPIHFKKNVEETDGIAWFSLEEVDALDTFDNIKSEIRYSFQLV